MPYIRTMNRSELHRGAGRLFGWGWQTTLARGLGVEDRTVRRWGVDLDVPTYVEAVIESLSALRQNGISMPERWTPSAERRRQRRIVMQNLQRLCDRAFKEFRSRGLDNVSRPDSIRKAEALVVAAALESQSSISAFRLGREIRSLADRC